MSNDQSDATELLVPYIDGRCNSPLEPAILDALRGVYDPEIPVSLFDLGLIYDLEISNDGLVTVTMTLTTPACPVAEEIPNWVRDAITAVAGVKQVEIKLVWEPFWKPEYMTEAARLELGLF